MRVANLGIESRHVKRSQSDDGKAESNEVFRLRFADQKTDERHAEHHEEPAGRDDEAGIGRRIAEEGLDELRKELRSAKEHDAERQHGDITDEKIAILEQRNIDDGIANA